MGHQSEIQQIRTISSALIAFYRQRWIEWGQSDRKGNRLDDYLYVIEFRNSDCDTDELFEAFIKANEALERKAYGTGQHHFGIGYLARPRGREHGLIRALIMIDSEHMERLGLAAEQLSVSSSGLKMAKCEIDAGDPDAHWRWLAEGVIASSAPIGFRRPRFALFGWQQQRGGPLCTKLQLNLGFGDTEPPPLGGDQPMH